MTTHNKSVGHDEQRERRCHPIGGGQHGCLLHDEAPPTPEGLAETVADRLKRSLRYANLQSAEMAIRLEVHRNTIGGYVTGKITMRPLMMRLWAQETGVPLSWFKTGEWPE